MSVGIHIDAHQGWQQCIAKERHSNARHYLTYYPEEFGQAFGHLKQSLLPLAPEEKLSQSPSLPSLRCSQPALSGVGGHSVGGRSGSLHTAASSVLLRREVQEAVRRQVAKEAVVLTQQLKKRQIADRETAAAIKAETARAFEEASRTGPPAPGYIKPYIGQANPPRKIERPVEPLPPFRQTCFG